MYNLYKKAEIAETKETYCTGWLPPLPDFRDYTPETPTIAAMSATLRITPAVLKGTAEEAEMPRALPPIVDLRQWFSPVEDQKNLGSCTANAAAGVVEYFQRKGFGRYIEASRLFIYKTTRNLMGVTGDTGAWLRNTMGALVFCGVPPERYWPYNVAAFDNEPSSFVYAVADNYEAVSYFCHDPLGQNRPKPDVLNSVKTYVAAGIPSMFGFFGFQSFSNSDVKGGIPYPCPSENAQWGHAIVVAGYDDNKKIKNIKCNTTTTGAFLIRNSWGASWGEAGYGWLPYAYILNGIALDFWSLLSQEWVNTGAFGL
jgi:C1A family cysteine protease